MNINHLTIETEDTFSSLLELAANNDTEGVNRWINRDPLSIDEVGQWYGRQKGSKLMVLEHRTPLMVAATYGSIDVLKLILSSPVVDVNRSCGRDKSTALHCAASSGSPNALDAIELLLEAGADPKAVDGNGHRPCDVIVVSPKFQEIKLCLENKLSVSSSNSNSNSPPLSLSPSSSDSPKSEKLCQSEKKEYPIDPSLPDIKNSIYSTDEFRMFSFKIRPCSRAYSHDWTECPFVHPGENARRRDPRKFHYSCVPCPEFRKGACRRGDMCEYAHGVFECWLHPAQYRTRLCKDGMRCNRRVCFFAHTTEELRPLYVSTGSAIPSPRSNSPVDFAFIPGSPSSFTPPMSLSNNGGMGWAQPSVPPTLHLPGSNSLQSSRLRSSLHARDMLAPANLDDLFSESSSPRACFSPTHKSAVFNQFQQQQQGMLSPINTNFSQKNTDNSSLSRMSPRIMDPISPMSSRVSLLAQREKQQFRSLSSRDLGSNSSSSAADFGSDPWSNLGNPDWGVKTDEIGRLRRSSSFEMANNGPEEPDLSWVQSLVKESPQESKDKSADARLVSLIAGFDTEPSAAEASTSSSSQQIEHLDQTTLNAWLEQMHLDQLMAQ